VACQCDPSLVLDGDDLARGIGFGNLGLTEDLVVLGRHRCIGWGTNECSFVAPVASMRSSAPSFLDVPDVVVPRANLGLSSIGLSSIGWFRPRLPEGPE
jgi:hypothetical protein